MHFIKRRGSICFTGMRIKQLHVVVVFSNEKSIFIIFKSDNLNFKGTRSMLDTWQHNFSQVQFLGIRYTSLLNIWIISTTEIS